MSIEGDLRQIVAKLKKVESETIQAENKRVKITGLISNNYQEWKRNPSDEKAKKEGQYQFAALTIKSVWQSDCLEMRAQQVTIRILERISCRPGGVDMIQGLYANVDGLFGLDVLNAIKVRKIIESWLIGGGSRIVLP